MNGPLKFLTASKILPLLDLLAKFKRVLACSCSPNFCVARKANFLFLLVLAKKSQCSACSRMLAKTTRHPYIKVRGKKTRNADDKKRKIIIIKKQLRKEIFLSCRCYIVGPFTYMHSFVPCDSCH